jgi:hypothetical protein
MDAPTYVPDTALTQGSSGLPQSPDFSQANAEARYLIREDALHAGGSTDVYF